MLFDVNSAQNTDCTISNSGKTYLNLNAFLYSLQYEEEFFQLG